MPKTPKPALTVDWASHAAARYACRRWHYSGTLPAGPLVRLGAWEAGRFIGVVVFSRGASNNLLDAYGLAPTAGAELTRVALRAHSAPVSRVVAVALRLLKRANPGLRLVVSFADPAAGHHGGIYQAGGWVYTGPTAPARAYRAPDGRLWHSRMVKRAGVSRVFGAPRRVWRPDQCILVALPGKHRYLKALDAAMAAQIAPRAQPYPKRGK
jgi:hypothetical protein